MFKKYLAMALLAGVLTIIAPVFINVEAQIQGNDLGLSEGTLALLREEMLEITAGIQIVPFSLATADWDTIQETSRQIHDSYILEKKLSDEQLLELEKKLPEKFKKMDAEFHNKAEKLGEAAKAHDSELVVFYYSRLIETCFQCHSSYATTRFDGFAENSKENDLH